MDLKVFDVEHGACALLTCDNSARLMVDAGHNASTGWRPGQYLRNEGIRSLEMLAVTNYDEDHVSGVADLFDNVHVQWLLRNKSVSAPQIRQLKSEDGMGPGIDRLVFAIENVFIGSNTQEPAFQGLVRRAFHNAWPTFDDENNLSVALHLSCLGKGVLFTGDLERAGLLTLLEREDFKKALRETVVFVAPHHGRESGCCEELFEFLKPYYVVVSDKGYMYDTQKTADFYRRFTRGGPFRGEPRHILTTRRDGRIGFTFDANSWWPY